MLDFYRENKFRLCNSFHQLRLQNSKKNIYINNKRSCCEDYELKYKKCPQD